jgi:hypothetical protein
MFMDSELPKGKEVIAIMYIEEVSWNSLVRGFVVRRGMTTRKFPCHGVKLARKK